MLQWHSLTRTALAISGQLVGHGLATVAQRVRDARTDEKVTLLTLSLVLAFIAWP